LGVFDWSAICVIGQILLDKTALTSARILVIFCVAGVVLGAIGLYKPLVEFAGAGATFFERIWIFAGEGEHGRRWRDGRFGDLFGRH
jgi:stage V sporulation protein AE